MDDVSAVAYYREVIETLQLGGVHFLVGGTYSLEKHAGIQRSTKDLDLFLRRESIERASRSLSARGFDVDLAHPHWLAKAVRDGRQVDLIFAGGNGLVQVDEEWFTHGVPDVVVDLPVQLCPAEEMIWSKSFVMERERFDGADVLHIIRESAERLDWQRLLRRFDIHAGVLLAHLYLFRFAYPSEARRIPRWVLDAARQQSEGTGPALGRLCRGTLLSRSQYLKDVTDWGYLDARLPPTGSMTREQIAEWTAEIVDPEADDSL